MTDLDLISIGAKHSTPGQFSREFTEEQWISAARAIEAAATAPLLERIAELEAELARQGAQKMASPVHRATMACVECGGVLGHARMCSKLPGYCGEADQIPDAQQAEPAMEPFLLRDLSQELGVAVPFLSQQIARNGLGNYSMNMALPVHVAAAMRKIHKQIEGFAQTNLEQPINQCDGCRHGLPIVNGLHDGGSWDKMVCQADRYIEAPQVDHEVSDLR